MKCNIELIRLLNAYGSKCFECGTIYSEDWIIAMRIKDEK